MIKHAKPDMLIQFSVMRANGWPQPRMYGKFQHGELCACRLADGGAEWRRQVDEDAWAFEQRVVADLRALAGQDDAHVEAAE